MVLCVLVDGLKAAPPAIGRRASLHSALALSATIATQQAALAAGAASVFVGKRFADPNHPGGTREVTLVGEKVGAYQLANVHGGGGRGEPDSYDLPAIILERPGEQASILIDFSAAPKYGPKDFQGVWDKTGIRFRQDGNFWRVVQ